MAADRRVQSLIFTVREEEQNHEKKTTDIKTFAVLPHQVEVGPKVKEVLSKNDIRILRNGDGPFRQFCKESNVEMMEVLFDEADVMAVAPDASKLFLAYDRCNEETMKLLFGSDFSFKSKFNFDSISLVMDGSKNVLEVLELLVSIKADISYANPDGGTFLHFAVEREHSDLLELLLKHGANAGATTNDGATPLHTAARKGYLECGRLLLDYGAPVNAKITACYPKDSTPLHFAVCHKHASLVKLLLEHGADVDAEDKSGTALLQAVKRRDVDSVRAISSHRPDVNNPCNKRAFFEAFTGEDKELVESLLKCGFSVVAGDEEEKQRFMRPSVDKDYVQIVKEHFESGAAPSKGSLKVHPLHLAAQGRYKRWVKRLLKAGSDVNVQSSDKQTPLFYALEGKQGHFEKQKAVRRAVQPIVNLLLKNGARVDVVDSQGRTALHKAAARGYTDVIEKLTQFGADINAKCSLGKTPLHYAADEGWFDSWSCDDVSRPPSPMSVEVYSSYGSNLFATIVSKGADVNARCSKGRTPLFYAVGKPRFFDIRDLWDCGAKINVRDFEGKTPLHVAAENGFVVFIEALIHHWAHIDARCTKGKTPLMYAVENDHFDAVIALLLHDARIDCVDNSGRTALHGAYEGNEPKLLETLLHYSFTDWEFLKHSFKWPTQINRRPLPERLHGPQPPRVHLAEFLTVCQRHTIRTKAAVPYTRSKCAVVLEGEDIMEFKQQCISEVKKMETLTVGDTDVTFYDVLTYSSNRLALVMKNDCFVNAMERLDYRKEIPIYADIVQMKFLRAYRRKKMMDCRGSFFKFLCPESSALPDELQEKVVSFFSNSDLLRLQMASVYIRAFSKPDDGEGGENKVYLLTCCSTKPPRVFRNEVDTFVSDLRDYSRPNEEPLWSYLTRLRLKEEVYKFGGDLVN